jgi:Mce-associated membrane protein
MGSGEDAGALASPAKKAEDDGPVGEAEDKAAGAEREAPGPEDETARAGKKAAGAEDVAATASGNKPTGAPGPEDAGPDESGEHAGSVPDRDAKGAPVWLAGMSALLALLIAGVAVSFAFLGTVRGSAAENTRRQAVVSAARVAAADLTTADYQNPQQYISKLRGVATGTFLSLLTNSSSGFKSVLVQGKVQTTGRVIDVGVQRVGADSAQLSVLAYITVKNSQSPSGNQRAYRLSVSMISAGSHWLVSNVEFVQ